MRRLATYRPLRIVPLPCVPRTEVVVLSLLQTSNLIGSPRLCSCMLYPASPIFFSLVLLRHKSYTPYSSDAMDILRGAMFDDLAAGGEKGYLGLIAIGPSFALSMQHRHKENGVVGDADPQPRPRN